jgi:hypothetical protein
LAWLQKGNISGNINVVFYECCFSSQN